MSLVTAVPFGLGVRATIRSKHALADARRAAEVETKRQEAEDEARARREQAERERKLAEQTTKVGQLIGRAPAHMGPLLEGIDLGSPWRYQPEHVRQRIEDASQDGLFHVTLEEYKNRLLVMLDGSFDGACNVMRKKLVDTWGPATNGVWIDPAAKQCATFDVDRCLLEFGRYLEPTDWVAALPFDLIGAPEAAAEKLPHAEYDVGVVYGTMSGLRYSKEPTTLDAYIENGRIVGIKATVDSDFDSMVAVREALNAKLKLKGVADPATGVWSWKKKSVVLDPFSTDRFYVAIGKIPWD